METDAYRVLEFALMLVTASAVISAGASSIIRFVVRIRRAAHADRAQHLELAGLSMHYLLTYSLDQIARALPMLLYGVALVVLNEYFFRALVGVGSYVGAASLVIGLVFIVFGVAQLFRLSDLLLSLRATQMKRYMEDGNVNHSGDWAAVNKHSEEIARIREFVIVLRRDQQALKELLADLDSLRDVSRDVEAPVGETQ